MPEFAAPSVLIGIRGFSAEFKAMCGVLKAVDSVYLDIYLSEVLGPYGNNGSAETALANAIPESVDRSSYTSNRRTLFERKIDILSLPKYDQGSLGGRSRSKR